MRTRRNVLLFFTCMALLSRVPQAQAEASSEAEVLAAEITSERIASWIAEMPNRPGSIAIFAIKPTAPLTAAYSALLEAELTRAIKKQNSVTLSVCLECRAPQIKAEGDNLVITKGMPDAEAMRDLSKKSGAQAFLMLSLFRTPFAVVSEVTLHKAETAEILAVEQFRVPAFELGNASLLLMLEGGVGRLIGAHPVKNSDTIPFTLGFTALEELGFGKGGLAVGGVFAGEDGNLGYIAPTIGMRSRFGATPVTSLTSFGAGFGYTGEKAGVALRGTFNVFIGTFTVLGIDAVYLVPVSGLVETAKPTLSGYFGVHLGIALGR